MKLITGYPDGNTISLAFERRELDGRTASVSSITATHPDWLRPEGPVHPLALLGRKTRLPALPDVPTARELPVDDRARAIIEAMDLPYQLARPYVLAPGLPTDRQKALREAFMAAANSKEIRAEADKLSLDGSPLDGQTVDGLVAEMEKSPPEVLDYLRNLLTPTTR